MASHHRNHKQGTGTISGVFRAVLGQRRLNKRESTIPLTMWNFYRQVRNGIPLTTNGLESWHTKLSHFIKPHKRTLVNLLEAIKLDQATNDVLINKLHSGVVTTEKKDNSFTARIENIVNEFSNATPIDEYLTRVSSLMLKV